nr:MAG TPA: hypothetical protein [Caudoviricetes sp.]
MAKLQYGNYSAWLTGDILRVACDNKLVRMETVPPDALRYFREAFDMDKRDAAREKAKALKTAQEASKPSKGKVGRPKKQSAAESLSEGNQDKLAQSEPAPAQSVGSNVAPSEEPEVLPAPAPDVTLSPAAEAELPDEEIPTPTAPQQDANIYSQEDIDAVSIYTVPIAVLAEALHERFGVYTVFRGEMPTESEVSPLTGQPMTAYQRGEAYQAARRAIAQGVLDMDFEQVKMDLDGSQKASEELRETFDRPTQILSVEDHRRLNTFDSRTSMAAMKTRTYDNIDEPVAEPNMMGEIIRPNW